MVSKTQDLKLGKTIDPQQLYKELEQIVRDSHVSYGDAIIHYCERGKLEIETVAEVVKKNPKLTSALQNEFENLNMLPKTARLPV
jgi:acid phosphatase class B